MNRSAGMKFIKGLNYRFSKKTTAPHSSGDFLRLH